MARTGNHYEKMLRGENSINIQDLIMVLLHCPLPHCQTDGRTDGWMDGRTDGRTKRRLYMLPPSGEHKYHPYMKTIHTISKGSKCS